jgi:hypothetical protein
MIPLYIDTADLMDGLGISHADARAMVDYVVKDVTARFYSEWEVIAANNLKTARNQYIANLNIHDLGWGGGAVVLTGWLPNAIESGWPAFDMKDGLLEGANAKLSNDGESRYNTIPYRFAVPTSIGESEVFAGRLPKEIHEIILEKPVNVPVAGGGRKTEPLKINELPVGYNVPQIKEVPKIEPTPLSWKSTYQHKAPIHQGISRVQDPVTKQHRYQSFRRVSDNSEPEAWIHPGFSAHNFAEEAEKELNLEVTIGNAIDSYLTQNGLV